MNKIDTDKLRRDYDSLKNKYEPFGEAVREQISKILKDDNLNPHLISLRVKEIDSLVKKIIKNDKYAQIEEITDICGIRIITYLASDVQKVCSLLRSKFEIDEANSVDKAKAKKHNEFGYISQHLVISMPDSWTITPTHTDFKGLKAEIQVRSLLQHAWAEIEHDLGYKSDTAPNYEFARGFNRLAAILESADLEFDRLQRDKHEYKDIISNNFKNNNSEVITINPISLALLVEENTTFKEVREMLADIYKIKFVKRGNYDHIIKKLEFFKIESINKLSADIQTNKDRFIRFVRLLFERRTDKINALIFEAPLEYFLHYLGSSKDKNYWKNYRDYGPPARRTVTEVVDFITLYKDSEQAINENQSIISYFEAAKKSLLDFIELYYLIEGLYSHCVSEEKIPNNYLLLIRKNEVSSNMEILNELWVKAYRTIHQFLHLKQFAKKDKSLEKYYLLSDIYISIVYYELITLWSNVPYVETEYKLGDPTIGQTNANIIIGKLSEKLLAIIKEQSNDSLDIDLTDTDLALGLLAKFELELKNYSKAKKYLDTILDTSEYKLADINNDVTIKDEIIFGLERHNDRIMNSEFSSFSKKGPVLSYMRYTEILLMCAEINYYLSDLEEAMRYINKIRSRNEKSRLSLSNSNVDFIGLLLAEWKENLGMEGSYFAAIKRNGYAIKLLEIPDYKIVLPIPLRELAVNSKIKQNMGY